MGIALGDGGSLDATGDTVRAYGRPMVRRAVVERSPPTVLDVLDRVLDKGIVIAFDVDVSLAGLKAVRMTGHVVVASIERYRGYAQQPTQDVTGDVGEYLGRLRGAHDGRPAQP